MPLAFYAITDGAMLVAVAKDCFQARFRWAQLTLDQAAFEERMSDSGNPRIALENARLRDLRMHRLTGRPRVWTKLAACVAELEESRGPWRREATEIPTGIPEEPSATPLPVWWGSDSTRKRNYGIE
jgi:hypothetical protein